MNVHFGELLCKWETTSSTLVNAYSYTRMQVVRTPQSSAHFKDNRYRLNVVHGTDQRQRDARNTRNVEYRLLKQDYKHTCLYLVFPFTSQKIVAAISIGFVESSEVLKPTLCALSGESSFCLQVIDVCKYDIALWIDIFHRMFVLDTLGLISDIMRLRLYHVEIPALVRSPKLSSIDPGQYLHGCAQWDGLDAYWSGAVNRLFLESLTIDCIYNGGVDKY